MIYIYIYVIYIYICYIYMLYIYMLYIYMLYIYMWYIYFSSRSAPSVSTSQSQECVSYNTTQLDRCWYPAWTATGPSTPQKATTNIDKGMSWGLADCIPSPKGSMYGIYANIWGILMVNVTIYGIITWILWVKNGDFSGSNLWNIFGQGIWTPLVFFFQSFHLQLGHAFLEVFQPS